MPGSAMCLPAASYIQHSQFECHRACPEAFKPPTAIAAHEPLQAAYTAAPQGGGTKKAIKPTRTAAVPVVTFTV